MSEWYFFLGGTTSPSNNTFWSCLVKIIILGILSWFPTCYLKRMHVFPTPESPMRSSWKDNVNPCLLKAILKWFHFEEEVIGFLRHGGVARRPLSHNRLKIKMLTLKSKIVPNLNESDLIPCTKQAYNKTHSLRLALSKENARKEDLGFSKTGFTLILIVHRPLHTVHWQRLNF